MKKMVFMAAFVAACAAFVACSSNDDLVQQKPDVPEKIIDEGTPMKIFVSDLSTRGTDFSSTNPLTAFTMYSTMVTETTTWTAGKLIEKSGNDWTTSGDFDWPKNDNSVYTFYAINDVANLTKESGHAVLPPSVSATDVQFNYTIPTDYANQVDLLVAKTSGSSDTGDPKGSLTVNFNHALAQITAIKVYCNVDKVANSGDKVNYFFRVNGVRLGGLQVVGTYTFGESFENDSWTVPTTAVDEDTYFEVPLDASKLTFANMGFAPTKKGAANYAKTLPLNTGDGGLYLIPQVAAGKIKSVGSAYEVEGAYAELDAQVMFYSDYVNDPDNGGAFRVGENLYSGFYWTQEASDAVGFGKIRVPLKFTLVPGKGYTLILDISKAVIYENEGSTVGTAALGESIFEGATITVG